MIVKLYLDTSARFGQNLVTLDDGQVESSLFPSFDPKAAYLHFTANKADSRHPCRHIGSLVLIRQNKFSRFRQIHHAGRCTGIHSKRRKD